MSNSFFSFRNVKLSDSYKISSLCISCLILIIVTLPRIEKITKNTIQTTKIQIFTNRHSVLLRMFKIEQFLRTKFS